MSLGINLVPVTLNYTAPADAIYNIVLSELTICFDCCRQSLQAPINCLFQFIGAAKLGTGLWFLPTKHVHRQLVCLPWHICQQLTVSSHNGHNDAKHVVCLYHQTISRGKNCHPISNPANTQSDICFKLLQISCFLWSQHSHHTAEIRLVGWLQHCDSVT